jgi:hypothetical protein
MRAWSNKRADFCAPMAANPTGESRLQIGQVNVIARAAGVDHDGMRALVVAAVDGEPGRSGLSHCLRKYRLYARQAPAGESPVTGGSGALRIAGAASWSVQRKMHDMDFRLHRRSGPQGGVGRDVAGHSFRTGKPCCHPSRTQAPSDVVLHPTPHPPPPQAGPARAKLTKKAPKQAKRVIGSTPRGLGPRVKFAPRILFPFSDPSCLPVTDLLPRTQRPRLRGRVPRTSLSRHPRWRRP